MLKKSYQAKSMDRGMTKSRTRYSRKGNANWDGAMIETTTVVFGSNLPNCSIHEEALTTHDIINCLVFSERRSENITLTFNKEFLRRVMKSHIHFLNENKII